MHATLNHEDPAIVTRAAIALLNTAHAWSAEEYTRAVDAAGAVNDLATVDQLVEHAERFGKLNPHMLFLAAHESRNHAQHAMAAARFSLAASLDPATPELPYEAGMSWVSANNALAAIACFQEALRISPELGAAAFNVATLSNNLRQFEQALKALDACVLSDDLQWMGLFERGRALAGIGRFAEACDAFASCETLNPAAPGLISNLSKALHSAKRPDDALAYALRWQTAEPNVAEAAVGRLPILLQNVAWDALNADLPALHRAMQSPPGQGIESLALMWKFDDPAALLRIAEARFAALQPLQIKQLPALATARDKKIKVGVLSADLSEHPVGRTTAALWENLDRDRIELVAYSWTPEQSSAIKRRLDRAFDRVVNIHDLLDVEAAQRIHDDGVDVLIDAMGMTTNERHAILLARPALVNVGFWGYPGTTGGVCDYLIADRILIPGSSAEKHYSEAVVRMPHTYASTASYPDAIPTMSRAEAGLPDGALVLASFNHIGKLTPECFEAWLHILKGSAGAVLWLPDTTTAAKQRLATFASARGVNSERLLWYPGGLPEARYLARIACADIALDCFPYGGHSTSCDILHMGVPLIARTGESFASRASSSILTAAGLGDLACRDWERYQALALRLANEPAILRETRRRAQAARTSALFDQRRYAASLSDALVRIGERARQRLRPEAFSV